VNLLIKVSLNLNHYLRSVVASRKRKLVPGERAISEIIINPIENFKITTYYMLRLTVFIHKLQNLLLVNLVKKIPRIQITQL